MKTTVFILSCYRNILYALNFLRDFSSILSLTSSKYGLHPPPPHAVPFNVFNWIYDYQGHINVLIYLPVMNRGVATKEDETPHRI